MNRRTILLGLGAAIAMPSLARAQTQYFEGRPSAPALERGLAPPVGMSADEFRRLAPERRPRVGLTVHFEFNSAELTADARATLDVLAEAIDKLPLYRFRIEGHTDAVGGDTYNLVLSQRRAASVVTHLATRHAIDPGRLESVGYGKRRLRDPANPNDAVNRRVEIANMGPIERPSPRQPPLAR